MSETRYNRLVDRQPTQTRYTGLGYVTGSIEIGMKFKSTLSANERGTVTVSLVDVAADRTLLGSISSIYKNNLLAQSFSFISNELFKLIERPAIQFAIEFFSPAFLYSYLGQIFKSEYCIRGLNNLLRDTVINISHKPSFSTRHFTEFPFSRSSAFGLQLSSEIRVLRSCILHGPGIKEGVIGTDRDVNDTTVDTKNFNVSSLFWGSRFETTIEIKISSSLSDRKCRRFDLPFSIPSVISWDMEENFNAPIGCSKSGISRIQINPDNTGIVSHSRKFFTTRFNMAFNEFQRFTRAVSCSLHQRGGEIRNRLTDITIRCIVATDLTGRMGSESPIGTDVKRDSVISHCGHKRFRPIRRNFEFQLDSPNHTHILIPLEEILNGATL